VTFLGIIILAGAVSAEPVAIDSARLNSLRIDNHMWVRIGDTSFMEFRSCRQPWLELKASAFTFDAAASHVTVSGCLVDGRYDGSDLSEYSFSVLVGTALVDLGGDSTTPGAAMRVRQRIPVARPDSVAFDVAVQPGDWLAIVPDGETTPDGYSVIMMAADVIRVGELCTRVEH
jgi:hypothetical protein